MHANTFYGGGPGELYTQVDKTSLWIQSKREKLFGNNKVVLRRLGG